MTDIVDFTARRWKEREAPQDHTIRDMLVEAIRQIDAGELEADHAILVHSIEKGDDCTTGWLQAGSFGGFAQIGVLVECARIMGNEA